MEQQNEAAILALLQKRDESALEQIRDEYGKLCGKLAQDILGCREDSEECVNDMLMKVWQTIPPGRPESLKAYLITLTRHLAVDRYRAQTAKKRGGTQFDGVLEELQDTLASDEDVSAAVEKREMTLAIERFLDTLSPQARKVFMRRYYMADSVRGIADAYGMGVSAVKISLMRTRSKLKQYLKEEGFL
ncbi:MAG: sigma-70 family RNA polymerase sigma factor [Oscillospiraceae bacterium]|nr:sigma-70 family RNA polymerase sigma factor [Oscillospiraceae bacterium]